MSTAVCGSADMAGNLDIVIQTGRVIDPAAGINEICSVGIEGAKIVDISAGHLDGKYTINADGCIVTPGLIDFHTHLFEGGSLYGIHPDCLLSQGVTAAVDAGTSGSAGFEAFYRSIIQNSILTVKAFISLGATGLCDPKHHQSYEKSGVNLERLRTLKERYSDTVLGIKVAMSRHDVGELGLEPLLTAVETAECLGHDMRVCVHSTDPPCSSEELLSVLRKGDILCHCYHGTGPCILDEKGYVREAYRDARRRGVVFDMANGINHFCHESALGAIRQGFLPDVISSDMVSFAYGISRRNRSLPYVMSKLMAMGMELTDIIRAVTQTPAELMGMSKEIGTLMTGAWADVAILRVENCPVVFEDVKMQTYRGETLLCPQMTIKNGQVVFFQNKFNLN